jgi:hypothetical protein
MEKVTKIVGKFILIRITPRIPALVYRTDNTNPPILFKRIRDRKWELVDETTDEVVLTTVSIIEGTEKLPDILARLNGQCPAP